MLATNLLEAVQGNTPLKNDKFFDEQLDQSDTKARIIQKYFYAWAKVITPTAKQMVDNKIAYIDLYAGPGRYKDGAASTPLLILEHAIKDPNLSAMLVTLFNDSDPNHSSSLQKEIDALPGIEKLKFKPSVQCNAVGEDAEKFFAETSLIPSFTFVDPWGYKGLSLKIVNGVIKDWGCDCVFFFNYGRINAGLSNDLVKKHMDALFGTERVDDLRKKLDGKTPEQRVGLILEELSQAIKDMGGKFVLPFRFKRGARISHCLIFVSKAFKGYEIMKGIMASESSTDDQGVASFTYSPADASTPLLFSLLQPFNKLLADLPKEFAGETLTMRQIYENHSVDTPYTDKNYKEALRQLEAAGAITADPPAAKRPKRAGAVTFADHVKVTFK
ncbi:three-Cys-motif partner protein TcmP [Bradyrhizobium japonicum]|uniref:three-Cys-motif partner protein TcmP n=1 Tax=Bradyrhizobium japonicum TaxID=375 RepID=UPI001E403F7B|nr:three-Cys-motif partner protein TcmP [Bradyrhizobium japonicum]MCD9823559.1 three-Cys-motif partner protein TcmP [Bradyrhizobium japonicum]MCD9897026.1 three-Cys-motif partner protein TcmP [Bradyrhizobium japonicum]MCP1766105.1 three-Cys-motif partner protein [Bradyrhizobium japonicum]MCP1788243.1 three-Cys-motif partner protein [Bradyrhizobium japonicum]MCP1810118.1 three-Cys-motif partner protein [Bradyrhizobium japonicum]